MCIKLLKLEEKSKNLKKKCNFKTWSPEKWGASFWREFFTTTIKIFTLIKDISSVPKYLSSSRLKYLIECTN